MRIAYPPKGHPFTIQARSPKGHPFTIQARCVSRIASCIRYRAELRIPDCRMEQRIHSEIYSLSRLWVNPKSLRVLRY